MTKARALFLVAALFAVQSVTTATAQAQNEGIKVHGDWKIVIRQPDGSVVRRYAFKNSLTPTGASVLAGTLTRNETLKLWRIYLTMPGSALWVAEPADPLSENPHLAKNLTLHLGNTGTFFELTGSIAAPEDFEIQTVLTGLDASPPVGQAGQGFSQRQLDQPIPVRQGQIIQVTVRFSFS